MRLDQLLDQGWVGLGKYGCSKIQRLDEKVGYVNGERGTSPFAPVGMGHGPMLYLRESVHQEFNQPLGTERRRRAIKGPPFGAGDSVQEM